MTNREKKSRGRKRLQKKSIKDQQKKGNYKIKT
jgi:hypothetical protein